MDDTDEPGHGPDKTQDAAEDLGPQCLLPYDAWTENALRQVVANALRHVEREGLPGGHHFYLTVRTDHPGTIVADRLRAQYPKKISIVLEHQFWDLKVDDAENRFSVGVSFGGVPTTLIVPFEAISYFADPHVRLELRFHVPEPVAPEQPSEPEAPEKDQEASAEQESKTSQVVSLDAFRRRSAPKD
jgi:hypothetical protein